MRFNGLMTFAALSACVMTMNVDLRADQYGLEQGAPSLQSAGPMTFGPAGILFVADTKAAMIYAIGTGDAAGDPSAASVNIEGLNVKLAELLKGESGAIRVTDIAVNPASGRVYIAVNGVGDGPMLVRAGNDGQLEQVSLENVPFAKAALPSPPEDAVTGEGRRRRNHRRDAVTDLAYHDGRLIVSGLSTAGSPSSVMNVPFPFSEFAPPTSLEIYHAAHGREEDGSAPRVFVPFTIEGEPHLLAGYVCTPLVKFPLNDFKPNAKTRGTTIAELGNRNRPLDMIVYEKEGASFLLMANSARGVMKISMAGIAENEGLNEPVRGGGTAGQPYDTITSLDGTIQLDKLNETHAVVVTQAKGGTMNLRTVELP